MSASDSLESVECDLRRRKPRKSRSQVVRETFGYCESEIESSGEDGQSSAGDLRDYTAKQVRYIRKKADDDTRFVQAPARDSGSFGNKFPDIEKPERDRSPARSTIVQGHSKTVSVGIGRGRPFNDGRVCEKPTIITGRAMKTIQIGQPCINIQPGGRVSKPRINNIQPCPANPVDLKSPYRTAIKTTDLLGYTNPWSFKKYHRDEKDEHRDPDRLRSPCQSKTFHATIPAKCYNFDGSIATAVQSYNPPKSKTDDTLNNENVGLPVRRNTKGTQHQDTMASGITSLEKHKATRYSNMDNRNTPRYTETKNFSIDKFCKPRESKGDETSLSDFWKKDLQEHGKDSSGTQNLQETVNQPKDLDLANQFDTASNEKKTSKNNGERVSKKRARVPKNANKPMPRIKMVKALKETVELTAPRIYYRTESTLTTELIPGEDGSLPDTNKVSYIERWRDEVLIQTGMNKQFCEDVKTPRQESEVQTEESCHQKSKRVDTPTAKDDTNRVKSVPRDRRKRKIPVQKVKAINIESITLQEDKASNTTRVPSNTKTEEHTHDVTSVPNSMDLQKIRSVLSKTNTDGLSSAVSGKSINLCEQYTNDTERQHDDIQSGSSDTSLLETFVLNSDTTLGNDTSVTRQPHCDENDTGRPVRVAFAEEPRPKRSLLKSLRHNIRRFGSFVAGKMSSMSCSNRVSVL